MKTPDIKLLWGKAGFRCSICKRELSASPTTTALIGEMAHIVAESDTGPRCDPAMPIEQRNSYANLILLCPTDHAKIDTDVSAWPVERLHQMKREHEAWVSDRLSDGSIQIDTNEAIQKLTRVVERQSALPGILAADIGNAQFLDALQKTDEWFWLKMNADRAFRDGYLDMLEQQAKTTWQQGTPPFQFEMLDGLVVFPDGYDEYRTIFGDSASQPRPVPFYVSDTRLAETGGERHLVHRTCIDVPWIPQINGFIRKRDPVTSLPVEVGDEPAPQEWGAYYWVRPHGCRIVVMGIGVLDPMEVSGCALWWSPKDSSPLLNVRACREVTPELRHAMNHALKQTYLRAAEQWSKVTPPPAQPIAP